MGGGGRGQAARGAFRSGSLFFIAERGNQARPSLPKTRHMTEGSIRTVACEPICAVASNGDSWEHPLGIPGKARSEKFAIGCHFWRVRDRSQGGWPFTLPWKGPFCTSMLVGGRVGHSQACTFGLMFLDIAGLKTWEIMCLQIIGSMPMAPLRQFRQ